MVFIIDYFWAALSSKSIRFFDIPGKFQHATVPQAAGIENSFSCKKGTKELGEFLNPICSITEFQCISPEIPILIDSMLISDLL